jgi:hypothetical protein
MAEGEGELSREEKIAAARARVDALKAQRAATGGTAAPGGAPGAAMEMPISAANVAGRPMDRMAEGRKVQAFGTINQAVDIIAAPEDSENMKKLLVGISGYQNPLRRGAFQVDYRYYAEARRRLEAAGYQVEESDSLDRPLRSWTPQTRGWTRVESS